MPGSATSRCERGAPRRSTAGSRPSRRRGRGLGWIDGDVGHGRAYRFTDPDGHVFELYYEAERYEAPEHLRPSWRNQPQRYVGRGAAVKRLDHVNVLAADVRANSAFAQDVLGYRLYERIELDDGTETGRLAQPLDRRARAHLRRGRVRRNAAACTTSRSGSTRARSAYAPPTSSSTQASRSRRRPRSTGSPRASSCTGSSPAATESRSRPVGTSSTTPTSSRSRGPLRSVRVASTGA